MYLGVHTMFTSVFLFVFLAYVGSYEVQANEKVVMCYYGTWATYRSGLGKFNVENINPFLCTHIVYSFVGINEDGLLTYLDPYLDLPSGNDNFGRFNALKAQNPALKTILAVGGWSEGSAKYSKMAGSAISRKTFVTSVVNALTEHGFDGFDVDWEYPNKRDTVHGVADIDNFTQLLKELREAFDGHGFVLSAAVSATPESAALSYNIPEISKYLDFVGLMTYDFYGSWDSFTGYNAPLHTGVGDNKNNVELSVQYWLDQGCPPEKLVLGVPFYGRTYTLANAYAFTSGSASVGAGISGPFTQEAGIIGYNEFCAMLQSESWDQHWDDGAKVPYAVQGRNWVSYDNPESLAYKAEYSNTLGLAGIMLWSIETDDFHGQCHDEDFPLLRKLNSVLRRNVTASHTTTTTESSGGTSVSPVTTTTSSTPSGFVCNNEGLFANPSDCSSFFYCIPGVGNNLIAVIFHCPNDLYFDSVNLFCNYPSAVQCNV